MELVLVNEKSHGNFYEGDCYILLSVSHGSISQWCLCILHLHILVHYTLSCFQMISAQLPSGGPTQVVQILLVHVPLPLPVLQTQKSGATARYDIHFWIGSASSQDEQGAAVIYTVQLDDFLGSSPIQHREVQNHESDAFRGYFKNGIM